MPGHGVYLFCSCSVFLSQSVSAKACFPVSHMLTITRGYIFCSEDPHWCVSTFMKSKIGPLRTSQRFAVTVGSLNAKPPQYSPRVRSAWASGCWGTGQTWPRLGVTSKASENHFAASEIKMLRKSCCCRQLFKAIDV